MKFFYLIVFLCLLLVSYKDERVRSKYDDPIIRKIADFKDARKVDSLLPYLNHSIPLYRSEAAFAFGTLQDSSAYDELYKLLSDPDIYTQRSAAFAIGQLNDTTKGVDMIAAIQKEKNPLVLASQLEALGKLISNQQKTFLEDYPLSDSVVNEGLAWGLYYTSIRYRNVNYDKAKGNIKHNTKRVEKGMQLVSVSNPYSVRYPAAHFLSQMDPNFDLTPYLSQIQDLLSKENHPIVYCGLLTMMRRVDSTKRVDALSEAFNHADYRVRVTAIRALHPSNFNEMQEALQKVLKGDIIYVRVTAAEYIASLKDAEMQFNLGLNVDHFWLQEILFQAALKNATTKKKAEFTNKLIERFNNSSSDLEKVLLLRALAENKDLLNLFISQTVKDSNSKIVKETAFDAMAGIAYSSSKALSSNQMLQIDSALEKGFKSLNSLMMGRASYLFKFEPYQYTKRRNMKWVTDFVATLNPVSDSIVIKYIVKLTSKKMDDGQIKKGIDWNVIDEMGIDKVVTVYTVRGSFDIQLDIENTPSSASHFYSLTKAKKFDGAAFYRVVPNFVIQGGSDDTGLNDEIRSEFSMVKEVEGSVSYASAGKDTESNHWVVHHSPDPWNNGRYSVFGKVIRGMEVVHRIEMNDKMDSIRVQ